MHDTFRKVHDSIVIGGRKEQQLAVFPQAADKKTRTIHGFHHNMMFSLSYDQKQNLVIISFNHSIFSRSYV